MAEYLLVAEVAFQLYSRRGKPDGKIKNRDYDVPSKGRPVGLGRPTYLRQSGYIISSRLPY